MDARRILAVGLTACAIVAGQLLGPIAGTAQAQVPVGQAVAPASAGNPEIIPGHFIVRLKHGVVRDAFLADHGLRASIRYSVINGFAARMSDVAAARLAHDARVEAVSPDLVVHASGKPSGKPGKGGGGGGGGDSGGGGKCTVSGADMPSPQVTPTGVARVGADLATATGSGVTIAIIDTGIDACHPDLSPNYKGGKNLLVKGKGEPVDDNGHGTHVAGIVAAADNGFGVVGVAPDASLYAVKVLDSDGAGSLSTVIKGLDWAVKNGMDVANLSLGALDLSLGSGPMCNAVASAVAAGVTVVVAAGNAASEALLFTPANCPDSLAVSAFVDSDGQGGGTGNPFVFNIDGISYVEYDDSFADSFSNFSDYCVDLDSDGACTDADAPVVDLMAPGTVILSTMPTYAVTLTGEGIDLDYDTLTGTSMASPHVAGAVALYLETHPGASPADVRVALAAAGECAGGGTGGSITCAAPWLDDPDFAWEPLLDAAGF
ncbi:MAG: S8 family serine peptidase [Nitrospirota bacterium]|jgi:subtilisin family serine protease